MRMLSGSIRENKSGLKILAKICPCLLWNHFSLYLGESGFQYVIEKLTIATR